MYLWYNDIKKADRSIFIALSRGKKSVGGFASMLRVREVAAEVAAPTKALDSAVIGHFPGESALSDFFYSPV